jgi:hypothetical protein
MRWERYAAVRGARFCVRDSTLRGAARRACASPRRIAVPAVGLGCGVDAGAREPCGGPYWERRFPTGSGACPLRREILRCFQTRRMLRGGGGAARPEPIEYRRSQRGAASCHAAGSRSQQALLPATRQAYERTPRLRPTFNLKL